MFLGEYQHSLDAKGRIILPAKFRSHLERGCVLTKGRDACIVVYPREEWDRVARRLTEMPMSSAQARNAARVVFSGASEQIPDGQGRVLVPENLRSYAALQREITIAGAGDKFEVWDRGRWTAHMTQAGREYSEMADADRDLPF